MIALGCLVTVGSATLIAASDDRQSLDVRGPATLTPSPSATDAQSAPSSTSPIVATTSAPVTTVGSTRLVSEVRVVIIDASGICGVATNLRPLVMAKGYEAVSDETSSNQTPRSVVAFADDGYRADADVLGSRLNMPVVRIPEPQRGAGWDAILSQRSANLAIVLGQDALDFVPKPSVCGDADLGTSTTRRSSCVSWAAGRADGSEERGSTC
jgi:hypothetical protein